MPEDRMNSLRGKVQVWIAEPQALSLEFLLETYGDILSEEELQRCHRFHFEDDRKHFVAAHALLRNALAHYMGCLPHQLNFVKGINGKPELAPQGNQPAPRFNLSHTRGMVACALTAEHNCGIDVEGIRPMKQLDGVAETVFSTEELGCLDNAGWDDASRLQVFFRLWTLKEAYIKATGLGMSAPLQQISIDPDTHSLHDNSRKLQDPVNWLLDSWQPTSTHILALACEGRDEIREIAYQGFSLQGGSLRPMRTKQVCSSGPEQ